MNIVIFGGSGSIGQALVKQFADTYPNSVVHAVSRSSMNNIKSNNENIISHSVNFEDEADLELLAKHIAKDSAIDYIVVATGILHTDEIMPEKSMVNIMKENLEYLFKVNTIIPTLIAKYFIPKLHKNSRSVFAILTDRVGSISDNNMGGWYGYRASKCALNMIIKNLAIETARKYQNTTIIGIHPGMVDSSLSAPFKKYAKENIQTPNECAIKTIRQLTTVDDKQNGKCITNEGSIMDY